MKNIRERVNTFLYLAIFFSTKIGACPYCAGNDADPRDKYIVFILSGFIILTYIPFYYLFRMSARYGKNGSMKQKNQK